MSLQNMSCDRFTTEEGYLIRLEVPTLNHQQMLTAVRNAADLRYGDYDSVSFTTSPGTQRFRSLGGGHNPTKDIVSEWECVEVTFFLPADALVVERVLRNVYAVHPSEEPVIHIVKAVRSLHIRGLDEKNPNRFWNRADSVREI